MTTFADIEAAARRERWAPRTWWALLALASSAFVWWEVDARFGGSWARAALLLLAVAWLSPLLAMASLKTRRPENPPPDTPDASPDAWKEARRALLSEMSRAWPQVAKTPLKDAFRKGIRELQKLPRNASPADLAAIVARVREEAWNPVFDQVWAKVLPDVLEVRDAFAQRDGDDSPDPRLLDLGQSLADAATIVLACQKPYFLAADLFVAARMCAALAMAHAPRDARAIPLSAAIALEWIDWSRPWLPATACENAARRVGLAVAEPVPVPAPCPPPAAVPPVSPPPPAAPDTGMATDSPPVAPVAAAPVADESAAPARHGHRRRVKVWRKSRRHRSAGFWDGARRQSLRFVEIFGAFFQRIRYFFTAWWLYR